MDFAGKRVLVTGGTRGIGLATVQAFLAAGASVALNGRSAERVARAVGDLAQPSRTVAAPGDVGTVAGCRTVVAGAVDGLGGLDVLVNNAGVGEGAPIEDCDEALWDRVLDVNLKGAFFCTKFALPALRASAGNVVNVASILAYLGNGNGAAPYCAAKGGLMNLTRELAVELGPELRVNCVCPGPIDTDMLRDLGRSLGNGDLDTGYEILAKAAPLNRVARPAEIAEVILFLASERASYVSGSVYVADGGTTANVRGGRTVRGPVGAHPG
jgi:NAD(P)-dependent dehydrogenase (short-subunit alcohol dehydrogenase family)